MEVYLRNWLEAAGNSNGWETVRRTKGILHGVDFAATSGVAIISVPTEWVERRRRGEPEPEGGSGISTGPKASSSDVGDISTVSRNSSNNDEISPEYDQPAETWILMIRLSPSKVSKNDDGVFTCYELIAPDILNSGYMLENGTIQILNNE